MPMRPTLSLKKVSIEQRDRLQALLKRLDRTDRAAIIMRYWHDCSEFDIADAYI